MLTPMYCLKGARGAASRIEEDQVTVSYLAKTPVGGPPDLRSQQTIVSLFRGVTFEAQYGSGRRLRTFFFSLTRSNRGPSTFLFIYSTTFLHALLGIQHPANVLCQVIRAP